MNDTFLNISKGAAIPDMRKFLKATTEVLKDPVPEIGNRSAPGRVQWEREYFIGRGG